MAALSPDVTAALATLRTRWGAAAPARFGEAVGGIVGALATVPFEAPGQPDVGRSSQPDPARVYSTGFPALDAILRPGGLPRGMGVTLRGEASSGRTTLALRLVAKAQQAGAIVAWLDLASAFDPVEAVARGVRPEWLVVVTPADLDEGIAIAGALLAGRTVDLLVIDLPQRAPNGRTVADRLARLAALARRAGVTLAVLEPPGLPANLAGAVGEATGVRLELARRSWIRLGRDVVGQWTEVVVARSRAGPPGRRATLRILYADGGERDTCLRRDDLLTDTVIAPSARDHDATPSPLSAPSPPRPREAAPALRILAGGAGGPRRQALDGRNGSRRRSGGEIARRPARDAARRGTPAGAGGSLPRPRSRG